MVTDQSRARKEAVAPTRPLAVVSALRQVSAAVLRGRPTGRFPERRFPVGAGLWWYWTLLATPPSRSGLCSVGALLGSPVTGEEPNVRLPVWVLVGQGRGYNAAMQRGIGDQRRSGEPEGNQGGADRKRLLGRLAVVLGAAAVGHVVLTRLAWVGIPLQTDTGMWAYIGSRILDGASVYRDLWESKPPGIYYTFAGIEWMFGAGRDGALLWMDAVVSLGVLGVTYLAARQFASRLASAGAVLLLSLVFCHRGVADWGNNVEKFVALFEMAACCVVLSAMVGRGASGPWQKGKQQFGNAVPSRQDHRRHAGATVLPRAASAPGDRRMSWVCAGACCGLAALFKQTGILFLLVATAYVMAAPRVGSPSVRGRGARAGWLWLGAALVWVPVVAWMLWAGVFDAFWHQVVAYDLLRVGSGSMEGSRLGDAAHWSGVMATLRMVAILFGPALIGAVYWGRSRLVAGGSDVRGDDRDARVSLVVAYWLLTTLTYGVAPHGYAHYLLQAAPPAAVLVAWWFGRSLRSGARRTWVYATIAVLIAGIWPLRDHFAFTCDRLYAYRQAYVRQAEDTRRVVDLLRTHTTAGQSVMVWPTDYAISYYAGRVTPLEASNSDVIFKGKIRRLDPPMPELMARLRANPPDVIVEWKGTELGRDEQGRPILGVSRAGLSLLEEPNEHHAWLEGRTLVALKRWVREHYGGQQHVAGCTVYTLGRRWRAWEDFLLVDPGAPP